MALKAKAQVETSEQRYLETFGAIVSVCLGGQCHISMKIQDYMSMIRCDTTDFKLFSIEIQD